MTRNFSLISAALCGLMALPALAKDRDSDGEVISVLPIYVTQPPIYVVTLDGEYAYLTMNEAGTSGPTATPASVQVNGTRFNVERSGSEVFLRNSETGTRIAARRVAHGADVNPTAFGLD